jgi:hypothetical protein
LSLVAVYPTQLNHDLSRASLLSSLVSQGSYPVIRRSPLLITIIWPIKDEEGGFLTHPLPVRRTTITQPTRHGR